jgi:hypothetical protein
MVSSFSLTIADTDNRMDNLHSHRSQNMFGRQKVFNATSRFRGGIFQLIAEVDCQNMR